MSEKLVFGFGTNDAEYKVNPTVNSKRIMCIFYSTWHGMLERCYSSKYIIKKPTYIGCSVCKEWLTFSNFKKWMEQQDYKGKQLDKDLLIQGNKEYGPQNCTFITGSLNCLLTNRAAARGIYPLGVCLKKESDKFQAVVNLKGNQKHLGYFLTPEEAHRAWQVAKKNVIRITAIEQTDERLKDALLLRCTRLQYDLDNNLETTQL